MMRFRGLPFASWKEGQVHFGSEGGTWEELTRASESRLRNLLIRLRNFRNPLASNTRHSLYRAYAERWLQSLVMQDVTRVDLALDPDHLYEQVFAQAGGQHGVLDQLAVTRTKRLAIVELKATENPDLPLQAADYWTAFGGNKHWVTWLATVIFREWNCSRPRQLSIWLRRYCVFIQPPTRSSGICLRRSRSSA
jgi:hypothetical protein